MELGDEGGREARRVPRIGRLLDAIGLLIFLGGAGLYAWAWSGFRAVREYQPAPEDGAWAAVQLADGYWRMQRIGTALMVAGVTVFVGAWWVARRVARAEDPGPVA
jgi:hypothetical protein